jgi:hypothetical protein
VPALAYLNLSVNPGGLGHRRAHRYRPDRRPDEVMSAYYETFPGMRAFVSRGSIISGNDGGTRSVNLDITGQDLANCIASPRRPSATPRTRSTTPRSIPRPVPCRWTSR